MKVMMLVTHLLGSGHLARALTLGRAFAAAGDRVHVVSGGMPSAAITAPDGMLVQLPPVRSDGVDFSRLMMPDGTVAPPDYMADRARALLEVFARLGPDVLITELFPFGRRILRAEFTAVLQAARTQAAPPLICASIRDILAPPSKPKKAEYADAVITEFYDAVLVHADPSLTPLELSWPVSDALRPRLHYTGFVAPPPAGPHPAGLGTGEVIVSAGGGDVGTAVYRTALAAAPLLARPMRLLVGGSAAAERVAALRAQAPDGVIVEAARPDFRQILHHTAASVSLCGYNTALDILQAGTPAVFVPFDEGSEMEQGLRANALAGQEGICVLPQATLSAQSFAEAVEAVIAAPRRAPARAGFDGAAQTVAFVHAREQRR